MAHLWSTNIHWLIHLCSKVCSTHTNITWIYHKSCFVASLSKISSLECKNWILTQYPSSHCWGLVASMQMEKCQKLPSPHFHPCLSLSHRHGKHCLSDATIFDMQLIMIVMSHESWHSHPFPGTCASWRDQLSYLWPSYHAYHIIPYHQIIKSS